MDQEPSHTSEQEGPTHSLIVALIVPDDAVQEATDSLNRLARVWPGWTQAVLGTLVFVPGDLAKCVITALTVHTVARGLPDWQFGGRVLR